MIEITRTKIEKLDAGLRGGETLDDLKVDCQEVKAGEENHPAGKSGEVGGADVVVLEDLQRHHWFRKSESPRAAVGKGGMATGSNVIEFVFGCLAVEVDGVLPGDHGCDEDRADDERGDDDGCSESLLDDAGTE